MREGLRNQLGVYFTGRCAQHREQAVDVRIFTQSQPDREVEAVTISRRIEPPLVRIQVLAQGGKPLISARRQVRHHDGDAPLPCRDLFNQSRRPGNGGLHFLRFIGKATGDG